MKYRPYTIIAYLMWTILFSQDFTFTIQGMLYDLTGSNVMYGIEECSDINVSITSEDGETYLGETYSGDEGELCFQINITDLNTDPEYILPSKLTLSQNYPNPFNPETRLRVFTPNKATFQIFDILGREIQSVSLDHPGEYELTWGGANQDGKGSSAGIYLYRVTDQNHSKTGKMTLLDGGATSGLTTRYYGRSQSGALGKSRRMTTGTLYITSSCITDIVLPITVSVDTTLHLLCNIQPYGPDQDHVVHIRERLTIDLGDIIYNDTPTIYEIEPNDHFTYPDPYTLQYIPFETEGLSVDVIAIDSTNTSLRDTITIQTESIYWDTTSHTFTYEVDTVGLWNSMILSLDVVNETSLLVGGVIYPDPDTGGYQESCNFATWDGQDYEIFSVTQYPQIWIRSIKYFADDDIWVTADCCPFHWDGNEWTLYHLPNMGLGLDVSVTKDIWGPSSNNLYFVGNKGIVHYDGNEFTNVGNGIDVPLTDIDGTPDGEHLFARGHDDHAPGRSIIMEYNGGEWDTLYYTEGHIWPEDGDYGFVEGIGVFGDTLYASTAAGLWKYNFIDSTSIIIPDSITQLGGHWVEDIHINHPNDIFFSCGAFYLVHYNGVSYYVNSELYDEWMPTPNRKSYYDGDFGVVVGYLTPEWMGLVVRWYHE